MSDYLGGQTVTVGKGAPAMGLVWMMVAMGVSCQLRMEPRIMTAAQLNPVTTTRTQNRRCGRLLTAQQINGDRILTGDGEQSMDRAKQFFVCLYATG